MKTLIRKELRENFKLALIGFALFTFLLVQSYRSCTASMPVWPWDSGQLEVTPLLRNRCCRKFRLNWPPVFLRHFRRPAWLASDSQRTAPGPLGVSDSPSAVAHQNFRRQDGRRSFPLRRGRGSALARIHRHDLDAGPHRRAL